jgi:hypothetical protein
MTPTPAASRFVFWLLTMSFACGLCGVIASLPFNERFWIAYVSGAMALPFTLLVELLRERT